MLAKSTTARDVKNNGPRFWSTEVSPADSVYGVLTRGIVDENEGGIVCYCHEINAQSIIDAFRAFTGEM